MKTCFQSFFKTLCKLIKGLGFPKNSKTDFKRDFVFKWKLFQVASLSYKKKRFCCGIKTTSKNIFVPKTIAKKSNFPKWYLSLLYKILVHKMFSTRFKLASQKPWITKAKWFQNEFGTWFAWVSKAHLRNILSSKN